MNAPRDAGRPHDAAASEPSASHAAPIDGPVTACRMDAATVERVRAGVSLRPLLLGCVATIVVGAGAYGATMGLWRSPAQAVFAGLKLVGLFAGLFALTTGTNVVLSGLLRARLSVAQVATCCLLGLTVTAAILGALAPVSWLFVRTAPPPVAGSAASLSVAHQLLTGHVIVFAFAGVLGVHRMHGLLRALIDEPGVARRVLWAWLAIEGLVGAELSWVARPFVGKPDLPVTFLRTDAFDSSFFDEIGRMTTDLGGPFGPWIAGIVALLAVMLIAGSLRARSTATFEIVPDGLQLRHDGAERTATVPWASIAFVRRHGVDIEIGRTDPAALRVDVIALPCPNAAAARVAYEAIERARHAGGAPFRRAPPQ